MMSNKTVEKLNQSRIAIIPARGGSKRIPGKNIRSFLGKPILAYSIETALASGLFSEVMVSTDDSKIAEIAEQYGATIPFLRSRRNADDFATTTDVLLEVLEEYHQRARHFDVLCCIYPTAVSINTIKLGDSLEQMESANADSTLPIVQFGYPVQRGLRVDKKNRIRYVAPENRYKRSQDLEDIYHDAGQFYWLHTKAFMMEKDLILKNNVPFRVSELEVQDIDREVDWTLAEIKYTLMIDV